LNFPESLEPDIGKPVSLMQLIQAGTVAAIADLVLLTLDGSDWGEPVKFAADAA